MPRTRKTIWDSLPATLGLLLFARRIEECLFDYSLDSYKAPALNTYSRCTELLRTISDVTSGALHEKAVLPIVAELALSISRDTAARALLRPNDVILSESENWQKKTLQEWRVQAELVHTALATRYEAEIVRQLSSLMEDTKRKEEILELTTSLVVEWIRRGVSPDYIYYRTRYYFFGPRGPDITSSSQFDNFVATIPTKRQRWRVILRAPASFHQLTSTLPTESLTVAQTAPKPVKGYLKEKAFLEAPHDGVYLTITGVEAMDPRAAQEAAHQRLRFITNILRYHIHRSPLTWSEEALVYSESNYPVVLRPSPSPVHKVEECALDQLPGRLKFTINLLTPERPVDESFRRISAVLDFHTSAVESATLETQLLSLWAALESLLPLADAESRISRIVDLLVPVLAEGYPGKLLQDLHVRLEHDVGGKYNSALAKIPSAGSAIERLGVLLGVQGYESVRDEIYGELNGRPLVRYRMFSLKKAFQSASDIRRLIREHSQRIDWQLRRIYRSRNLLVHAGRSFPYTEALVENLHAYVDRTIALLAEAFSSTPQPSSIDTALLGIRLAHKRHLDLLDEARETATSDINARAFLFGS